MLTPLFSARNENSRTARAFGNETFEEDEKTPIGNADYLAKNLAKGITLALRPPTRWRVKTSGRVDGPG